MLLKNKMHFEISERKMMLRLMDIMVVISVLNLVQFLFDYEYFNFLSFKYFKVALLLFYLNIFGAIFEMYNLQTASNHLEILKSTLLAGTTTVFVFLFTPVLSPVLPQNRLPIVVFYVVMVGGLLLWRLFYVYYLASHRFSQNVILICDKAQVNELVEGLEKVDPHYKIVGYVNSDSLVTDAVTSVRSIPKEKLALFVKQNSISEIVIASQNTEGITAELYQQLLHLLESGKVIREYTQVYESKTQRIPVQFIARDFYRFFPFSRSNSNRLYLLVVRVMELLLSVIGLFVTAVLIPFVLIGNAFGNRGSLFYTQERIGKDGAVFKIYKFRTMSAHNPSNVLAKVKDCRVTPFGKFMRKTRIDEFPQFVNVLKGDMAVIGPRPEQPFFVKEIAKVMPFYETRHIIRPGLTGWAQVNYSYGESIEESLIKLQYDLYYIKHRSVFLDLSITLKTITTIVFYRGQ
ncbi:exopolysaccharide biosynthesis polyprenyl glycosylphosphotransferase [Flavobacterium agrisoli]|uniref:Exopolysaccharide biosynthesis polyprenyl glycosylphosphotransferase n=1 Tax=Flavobacterium agrisoli TaxID=2793066 RepID=A0A934PNE5_9FLAO|nr:exopolysaccharide biosynthesis polyprenyl glycosylphosphotransferase [Flavobacterium agrisoli]MBK0370732.1 exopolysaccharide biosynthesis polyprenyl glycosylphosphotransferase [Flavobacterium agrisoli]